MMEEGADRKHFSLILKFQGWDFWEGYSLDLRLGSFEREEMNMESNNVIVTVIFLTSSASWNLEEEECPEEALMSWQNYTAF